MKKLNKNLLFIIGILSLSLKGFAQTTTIDFTTNPYINNGNNTWDPNYFNNTGCSSTSASKRFGPNPTPLNGHNIRTAGGPSIYILKPMLDMSAQRLVNISGIPNNSSNDILSIEYAFKANKSYTIELIGSLDQSILPYTIPESRDVYNGVFWIKLDDNPEIDSPYDKCNGSSHPVHKSVSRYSKLIADPNRSIRAVNYSVKFSPLENKNALKIIYDFGPVDDAVAIAKTYRLKQVKITEMPYEADGPVYAASYENIPRSLRVGAGYSIETSNERPPRASVIERPVINSNQWTLNESGSGYYVKASSIIPNFYVSTLISLYLNIPWNGIGRPTRGETYLLPKNYQGIYFNYTVENGDIIITASVLPDSPLNFQINYEE